MTRKLSALLGSILVLGSATVLAHDPVGDPVLKGKFRYTADAACTESVGGFQPGPALMPALFDTTSYQEKFAGTMAFDGAGGAIQTSKGLTLFNGPSFNLPLGSVAGTFDGTCSYTYAMTGELSFSMQGSCSGTLPLGPAAGQTFNVTGVKIDGQISRFGEMILLSATEPSEQELVLGGGYVAKRFCIQTLTLIRTPRRL